MSQWLNGVFEHLVHVSEGGPLLLVILPALHHDPVDLVGTLGRWGHPVVGFHLSFSKQVFHKIIMEVILIDQFHVHIV